MKTQNQHGSRSSLCCASVRELHFCVNFFFFFFFEKKKKEAILWIFFFFFFFNR